MKIELTLVPDDLEDVRHDSEWGLTVEAYDRLVDYLADAGFLIVRGPVGVPD